MKRIFSNWERGIFVCMLFISALGVLAKFEFLQGTIGIYVLEILGIFLVMNTILHKSLHISRSYLLLLSGFIALGFYQTIVHTSDTTSFLSSVLLLARVAFFFILAQIQLNPKPEVKNNLIIILFTSLLTSSFLQFVFLDSLTSLTVFGYDAHLGRLFGVYFDTNITAVVMSMSYFFVLSQNNFPYRRNYLILFALAIILTFSRSIMLIFLMINAYYFYQKQSLISRKLLLVVPFLLILVSVQITKNIDFWRHHSIISRLQDYQVAWTLGKHNLLFGNGLGAIPQYRKSFQQEKNAFGYVNNANNYLSSTIATVFVWVGMIGLCIFAFLIYQSFYRIDFLYVFYMFILSGFFDNNIFHPLTWIFIWTLRELRDT